MGVKQLNQMDKDFLKTNLKQVFDQQKKEL